MIVVWATMFGEMLVHYSYALSWKHAFNFAWYRFY